MANVCPALLLSTSLPPFQVSGVLALPAQEQEQQPTISQSTNEPINQPTRQPTDGPANEHENKGWDSRKKTNICHVLSAGISRGKCPWTLKLISCLGLIARPSGSQPQACSVVNESGDVGKKNKIEFTKINKRPGGVAPQTRLRHNAHNATYRCRHRFNSGELEGINRGGRGCKSRWGEEGGEDEDAGMGGRGEGKVQSRSEAGLLFKAEGIDSKDTLPC